jgi:hypothetical protein
MSYNARDSRTLASSQSAEVFPFVQTATSGAARQRVLGRIIEIERAQLATHPVPQRKALSPLALPPEPNPKPENQTQEEEQVDKNEVSESDPDHGACD